MEAFVGTWQVDLSKTEGLEGFAKVMSFSEEQLEKYKTMDYAVNLSQDGETIKIEVDLKGAAPNTSYSLKPGDTIDYKSPQGFTAKLTLVFEDGKAIETYELAEKEMKWTVTRTVEGTVMTSVTEAGDAKMVQYLNKV